ncbi:MAG TPA: ABC transporter ATP-binding protein, partial [Candidatus Krumholzibacterium sp.]|nr:ABC transporter ATP-binding protein [Candidatus Krumholzibacterium sp.]
MENILELKGLRKRYGTFSLDVPGLEIPRGHIVGLIGPNGSGKTTMMRILMDMIRPDEGCATVFGLDPHGDEKEIKDRIGYVGEEQYYYENKRVLWTGRFVSHYFSRWDQGKFDALLGEFQIDPRKKIKDLSRGMKVKLSIAIALSHDPEMLLLDEPTSGLDPVIRREILDRLMSFRGDEERTIFISSHITDDIMRIADRVAFIVDGRIVIDADKDDIVSNWKRIHFKKGSLPAAVESSLKGVKDHALGSSGVTSEYSRVAEAIEPVVASGNARVEN